jgi:hypothetical protein
MGSLRTLSNIMFSEIIQQQLTPATVPANSTVEQTFPLPGAVVTDYLSAQMQFGQSGLSVDNIRVSAPNVMAIAFSNPTGTAITPTAGSTYFIKWERTPTPVPSTLPRM